MPPCLSLVFGKDIVLVLGQRPQVFLQAYAIFSLSQLFLCFLQYFSGALSSQAFISVLIMLMERNLFISSILDLFISVFIIFWSIGVASPVRVNLLLWTSPPGLNGSMLMVANTSPKARAKMTAVALKKV